MTIPQTIILFKDFLKQVPGDQDLVNSLNTIRAEPQSMTEKFHTVILLNCPIEPIM